MIKHKPPQPSAHVVSRFAAYIWAKLSWKAAVLEAEEKQIEKEINKFEKESIEETKKSITNLPE